MPLSTPDGLPDGVTDCGFLPGMSLCTVGRSPNFWKYELQTADSSARREPRHFKTSISLRTPAQSLCESGPHDARSMLPIFAGGPLAAMGASGCVGGVCALGAGATPRGSLAEITFPHIPDNSPVWFDKHWMRRPPPGCTPAQNRCKSLPQAARSLLPPPAPAMMPAHASDSSLVWADRH